jgi:hypothetical protein
MKRAGPVPGVARPASWVGALVGLMLATAGHAVAAVAPPAGGSPPFSCAGHPAQGQSVPGLRHRCLPISTVGPRHRPVAIGLAGAGRFPRGAEYTRFVNDLRRWLAVDPIRFGPEFAPRRRWIDRIESISLRFGPWTFTRRVRPADPMVIDFHDADGFLVRVRFEWRGGPGAPIVEGVHAPGGQPIPPRFPGPEPPPTLDWRFSTHEERDRFLRALARHDVEVSGGTSGDGIPGAECRYVNGWLGRCRPVDVEP